ncbi:hypothetical protein L1887_47436 [Cichorium endivia]|nr:hypothetical protein L1887_47436 [Cichorium endivia]
MDAVGRSLLWRGVAAVGMAASTCATLPRRACNAVRCGAHTVAVDERWGMGEVRGAARSDGGVDARGGCGGGGDVGARTGAQAAVSVRRLECSYDVHGEAVQQLDRGSAARAQPGVRACVRAR